MHYVRVELKNCVLFLIVAALIDARIFTPICYYGRFFWGMRASILTRPDCISFVLVLSRESSNFAVRGPGVRGEWVTADLICGWCFCEGGQSWVFVRKSIFYPKSSLVGASATGVGWVNYGTLGVFSVIRCSCALVSLLGQ